MTAPPSAALADMNHVPPSESGWRYTVQILAPGETVPLCSPSTSLIAHPDTSIHDLVQSVEHGAIFPMSARHLHLVVSSAASPSDCLTDPPQPGAEDDASPASSGRPSADGRSLLVNDLARSMPASNLTAAAQVELTRLASRIHRRLALQRGVHPEPLALQVATWLSTRAYMALSLEDLELDFSEAEPSSSSH